MNLAQISSSLIFITTIAIVTGEKLSNSSISEHFRLPSKVVPKHYAIRITEFIEKYDSEMTQPSNVKQEYGNFLLYGESNITIDIVQSTQSLQVYAINISIGYNTKATLIKNNTNYKSYTSDFYIAEKDIINIYFSNVLHPGHYILTLEFEPQSTDDNTENFFGSSYINKEKSIMFLLSPHIQVDGTRRLFPCWDEPHFKTTFAISVKHHRNLTALSNMPIESKNMDDDEFMWTHFQTTPPMSIYQVSVVVTNFSHIHINENIKLWCENCSRLQSLKYAEQVIKNITLQLKSEFNGIKIPKMDHIAIPNFPHDGTSKWGLIFHREADLIYDEKLDPLMRKTKIAHSIAPKIAYQWLGNVITPSWWTDFWLYDGLATLFGEKAIAKVYNNSQMMDLFIVQSQYDSLHLDSHLDMNPPGINSLSEIDSIFSSLHYMKVIIVLRMLQNEITDEVFREGVRTLLNNYTFRALTPNKFWSMQEDLANLSQYYTSHDFQKWIIYRHYPVIRWTHENPFYGTLAQYFNTSSYGKWWIPINLVTKFSLRRAVKILLTPREPSTKVHYFGRPAEDDWIMVDIRQAGYYRADYDLENWLKIARYLSSGEYKIVSVINRAKIIDDVFHFMMTRQINSSIFWIVTKYLSRETDYVAWYPMFKVFEYISSVFPLARVYGKAAPKELNFINVKEKMRELLAKPLEILGFEDRPIESDFTKCLRQEIVKWACTAELSKCLARMKREQHLEHSELDNFIYWKESRRNATKEDINIYIRTFQPIIAKYAKNEAALYRILWNLQYIKPPEISTSAALINIINHIYNTTLLGMLHYTLQQQRPMDLGQIESKVYSKIIERSSEIERQIDHFDMLLYKFVLIAEKSDVRK